MSRKDTVNSLFLHKLGAPNAAPPNEKEKERVRTGAISAMGSSLQQLTEGARNASRLQEQLATGNMVIEIEPDQIDGSMVRDRLLAEVDPSFDALVASMEESGQQVPILVRPHPDSPARYQVAYGHRRLRAAAKLGRRVKAIVQNLTDSELVVAQGKENVDRKDLSFIEKALFARRLEDMGFERSVLMAALSTDKGDLSRYISVARMIPETLLDVIGPAGKAGRARWLALADRLKQSGAEKIVEEVTSAEAFHDSDSDTRFVRLFAALELTSRKAMTKVSVWKTDTGLKAATIEYRQERTTLTIDEQSAPRFGAFVAAKLDELYVQFTKEDRGEGGRGDLPDSRRVSASAVT